MARSVGFVALIAVFFLAAAGAHASAPGHDELDERILVALDGDQYSEALRLADQAVAAYPESARMSYLRGFTLKVVGLYAEAVEELERGLTMAPDDVDLLVELSWSLWGDDQLDQAVQTAARAAKLAPDSEAVADLLETFSTIERITKRIPLEYAAGSAAAFVNESASRVARGDLAGALADDVDRGVMNGVLREVGGKFGDRRVAIGELAGGLATSWRRNFVDTGNEYVGYEVDPEPVDGEDGTQSVYVNVLISKRTTEADIQRLAQWIDSPDVAEYLDDKTRSLYGGLNAADRRRVLDAMTDDVSRVYYPIEVIVRRAGDRWTAMDIVIENVRLTKLPAMAASMRKAGLAPPVPPRRSDGLAYSLGRMVGKLLVLFGVCALGIKLSRWQRGKKERESRPPEKVPPPRAIVVNSKRSPEQSSDGDA